MAQIHQPRKPSNHQSLQLWNNHYSHNCQEKHLKKTQARHQEHKYVTPCETIHTSYDVLEIQYHRHLHNQTTYLVTQWRLEILTQEQIDISTKEGFKSKHIQPSDHTDGSPLYEVHWEPAWQLDSTIMDNENGPISLQAYKQITQEQRRVKRRTPQWIPSQRRDGDQPT